MRRDADREERNARLLAGRLELYPMLALFAPRLWRKRINAMHEARAK